MKIKLLLIGILFLLFSSEVLAQSGVHLFLIDEKVENSEIIEANAKAGLNIKTLRVSSKAGFGEITELIKSVIKNEKLLSVNIFSHGKKGQFELGSEIITYNNVLESKNSNFFYGLNMTLEPSGSLNIFSCESGSSDEGNQLFNSLKQLGNYAVAMSTDITGGQSNWKLELFEKESFQSVLSDNINRAYSGNLQVATEPGYTVSTAFLGTGYVTEMTTDWAGKRLFWHIDNSGSDPTTLRNGNITTQTFALVPGIWATTWHPFVATDIEYYNNSIFTWSNNILSMRDLSAAGAVTLASAPAISGNECGFAVIGDTSYFQGGGRLWSKNLTTGVVTNVMAMFDNSGLEYCQATNKLYYLNYSNNQLCEVNLAGPSLIVKSTTPGGHNANFAVDPAGQFAYVHYGTTVQKVNLTTGVVTSFVNAIPAVSTYSDVRFGPSTGVDGGYSLYIGGSDRIWEVKMCTPSTITPDTASLPDLSGQCTVAAPTAPTATNNCGAIITGTTSTTFPISAQGTTVVTWTYTSGVVTTTQTQNVIVIDNTAPTAICQNISIPLDASGNATITSAMIDNGSSDNCGTVTLALDQTTFDCTDVGTNNVTLTVTEAPVGGVYVTNPPSGLIGHWTFEPGQEFTDLTGNWSPLTVNGTAAIANGKLDVDAVGQGYGRAVGYAGAPISDKTLISYVTLDNFNQFAGSALTIDALSVDKFDGIIYSESQPFRWQNGSSSGLRNQPFAPGFAETGNNNLVQVALTYDVTGPNVLITGYRNGVQIGSYTIGNAATWTAGDVEILMGIRHHMSGFPIGAMDAKIEETLLFNRALSSSEILSMAMLSSTCIATITVVDAILPTVITQNITVQLDPTGNATITAAQVNNGSTDNCSIATMTVSPNTFNCTNVGANIVTLTVTDVNGNISTGTAIVTIQDTVLPTVITQNITVQLDPTGNATITAAQVNNGSTDNCSIATMTVSPNTFNCTNVGANIVTLTVTDVNGNISTGTATVTIQDTVLPTVITQDITVQLDPTGNATITAAQINNGSTDNCSIATMTVSPNTFTCAEAGLNTVTLTVTDVNGNINTATAIVTIQDTVLPTVITQNITVQLDPTGNATITAAQINNGSTDNCSIATMTVSPNTFNCANIGANIVTLTVTDTNGNISTGTAIVTIQDTVLPTVITQNITVQLDLTGNATITAAQVNNGSTDNCSIATMTVSPNTFNCTNVGANIVTLTVTDVNGNISTGTATITIQDTVLPTVITQNITVQLDATGNATITAAQVNNGSTDNCSIATMTVSPNTFNCTNVGANIVTLTVTDVNGNISTGTATITIQDTVLPTVITQNITVQLDPTGNATITAAQVNNGSTDNCSIATMTVSPNTFNCTNVGANIVTLTVTDVNGNISTGTATITIQDTVLPTVITQNITVQLDPTGNATITAAQVNNGSTDNCSIATMTVSPNTFNCTNVGANIVTLTVTDVNGNISTGTATITIQDTVLPTVITQNITVQLDPTGNATITAAQVNNGSTDNCSIATMTVSPNTFNCTNVGANIVTLTVTDVNGNISTGTAIVTIQDTVLPTVITQNITVQLDPTGNATITAAQVNNGSTDNCSIATMTVSPNTFNCTNVGANIVTLTVTDVNGNISTGTATVTIQDTVLPTVITQNITVQLDPTGNATITAAQINNGSTDNCSIATMTVSPNTFTCAEAGLNTVTLTVTDVNGNINTATAIVTVDNIFGDNDSDGIKDNCDDDDDNDGVLDTSDNCELTANSDQADNDADGMGDLCDDDDDNDGLIDTLDNCQFIDNPNQEDRDNDGIGDVCDLIEVNVSEAITPNGDGINDTWMIYNIENHPNNSVRVFNRWGSEVFYAKGYRNDWNGAYKNNSQPLPDSGSYYYQLDLDGDGSIEKDGWIYITRQ